MNKVVTDKRGESITIIRQTSKVLYGRDSKGFLRVYRPSGHFMNPEFPCDLDLILDERFIKHDLY